MPPTTDAPPSGSVVTPPSATNGTPTSSTPASSSASLIPPPLVSSSAAAAASPKKQAPLPQPAQPQHQQYQPAQQQQQQQQAYSGSRSGGFVDVLRSMGNLALSNAHDIREELRFLRRRRGKQEEAIVLSELAALASCLNELVVSTMTISSGAGNPAGSSGSSGSNEEGGNEGEAGNNKAGGGAVAVEPSRRSLVGMLSYEGLLPAFQHAAVPAPIAVLGDAALLHYCLEFLVEGRLEHRKQLGDLALVCRQWRDLAQSERFWKPIVLQLFPRLCPTALDHDEEDAAAAGAGTAAAGTGADAAGVGTEGNNVAAAAGPGGVGNGGVVVGMGDQATVPDWYRKYLIQFGRCLFDRPIRQG